MSDKDTIYRQDAINYFVTNVGFHDEDGYPIEDSDELRKIWTEYFDGIPPVQTEITDEQAIEHLQASGWMQDHDKQMYEMGCSEQTVRNHIKGDAT